MGGEAPSASTLASWTRPLLGGALGLFKSLASIVFGSVVVVFVAFYLAASPSPAVNWVVRLFPQTIGFECGTCSRTYARAFWGGSWVGYCLW
jgi:predicted PurR-regulated permease PerM